MRTSEIFRLRKTDVNFSDKTIFRNVQGVEVMVLSGELLVENSKYGKPRPIPMTPRARRILETLCADVTTGVYIFVNPKTRKPPTSIKTAFKKAIEGAGLEDFTFHDLEGHTFVTNIAADPFTRRDLLGPSSVRVTEGYTHSTAESRRQAIASLDRNPEDRGKIVAEGERGLNAKILNKMERATRLELATLSLGS